MNSEAEGRAPVLIRVRPDEADPYRIAHHSRYAVWAEEAMDRWLEAAGRLSPYRVTDFTCKYIASAMPGDEIAVTVRRKAETEEAAEFAFSVSLSRAGAWRAAQGIRTAGQQLLCTGTLGIQWLKE